MQHVSHLTIHGIASALTMRRRQEPIHLIVKLTWEQLVGPCPTGRDSRRWNRHMLNIAIWAMVESNWTTQEIQRATGKDEFYQIFAANEVQRLRDGVHGAAIRKFTDAVMAKLEDE